MPPAASEPVGQVAAEVLRVETEPLERYVQRRQVQFLQVPLVVRRMEQCELNRRIEVEHIEAVVVSAHELLEVVPPARVLQADAVTVVVPVLGPLHAIDFVHELVRFRIIRRHGRVVGVIWVVEPGPHVRIHREIGPRPPFIRPFFLY